MLENILPFFILIMKLVVCIVFGLVLYNFLKADLKQRAINKYNDLKEVRIQRIKLDPDKYYVYIDMQKEMTRKGITYRLGGNFTPVDYVLLRAGIATAAFIAGSLINLLVGVVFCVFAIVFVPYNFDFENKQDNKSMLKDIGQIYTILSLQIKNGVPLSKVIYECYRSCQQKRLKQALLEFSLDIDNFANVHDATEEFRGKFTNPHIEMFAKCIDQVVDTGQSASFFEDLNASVESIHKAINLMEEEKANNLGLLFNTLIFVGILIYVFYVIVLMAFSGGAGLFTA